ncbi:MAG: PhoH family protein [Candidatus Moranbacteria bacterium GW2011_GWF2_37_7]|nr:MAG: PhoH family protein [Candidatus Moranbacteria bacterium GW2011_GWF2_37_7]
MIPESNGEESKERKKMFIVYTNILVEDQKAILSLKDNYIVIPFSVISELDVIKKRMDELGANARHVSRFIRKVKKNGQSFESGISLENGGMLFVDNEIGIRNSSILKDHNDTVDHRLIAVTIKWEKSNPHIPVILLTNDINLRTKANSFGVTAEIYKTNRVNTNYLGFREIYDNKLFELIKEKGLVTSDSLKLGAIMPNECFSIKGARHSLPAIFNGEEMERIILPESIYGIKPKNPEQELALGLLLNPNISIVTINGKAGTGKTLLALAAALHQLDEENYKRISVGRPIVTMGNDIGFLPGDLEEKLNPWMKPIHDNLDIIFSPDIKKQKKCPDEQDSGKNRKKLTKRDQSQYYQEPKETWQKLISEGLLCVEPLAFIRGRSIPNQILIIDEAQNLNRNEIKTIITRIGENSKIILTGDTEQIDNPYLDKNNNGLSVTIEKFKKEKCAGHITLTKSERSKLAELAANIL